MMLLVGENRRNASGAFWSRDELHEPHSVADKAVRVRRMFDRIARQYDRLNHWLSLGQDRRWRRRSAAMAQLQAGERVLDVCCGTGDLAAAAVENQPALRMVAGIDFSPRMLELARQKQKHFTPSSRIEMQWICGDAEKLPFDTASFDAAFCGFGLRNLQHPAIGIREIARVVRPGGRFVALEFAWPEDRLGRWTSGAYLRCMAPLLGRCLSSGNGDAYAYLPASVAKFNGCILIEQWMREAGLTPLDATRFMFGMVVAMLGRKNDGET
ncbi:MAG: ubiquinone/menaquinone biosynthesis methyltransferase [Sedimentisphaerales bacterium]|nr:ubiquinone/menaquinone biosynthesis methyltransferase [Sedimentisphaerales bacterium]